MRPAFGVPTLLFVSIAQNYTESIPVGTARSPAQSGHAVARVGTIPSVFFAPVASGGDFERRGGGAVADENLSSFHVAWPDVSAD
jgi:hypothetical protein